MAIELEKKYKLTDDMFDEMFERLAEAGARYEGEDAEENTIYDLEGLTGRQGVLRVRSVGPRTLLTLKRRLVSDSSVKQQLEYESEVSDRDAIEGMIGELGLTPELVYEKRRKIWTLADAEVVLDILPFGKYMEIEGTLESIAAAERLLNAGEIPVEPRTYPNLTAEFGRKTGDTFEARFEKISSPE